MDTIAPSKCSHRQCARCGSRGPRTAADSVDRVTPEPTIRRVKEDSPSRTAHAVAVSRAAHQILDLPRVFEDPVALTLLGPQAVAEIRAGQARHDRRYARYLRGFLVARSRLAEDALSEAIARGVRQYVLLGAGLDTFAHRNPHQAAGMRVFEVDHPATQEWKRHLISQARLKSPQSLVYVPVDFERDSLAERLASNGFHANEPAFFSWLGVTMYLSPEAVQETLRFVAQSQVSRSGIVFDYLTLPRPWDLLRRGVMKAMMRRVATEGEPWRTFFEPRQLHGVLLRLGFATVRDFGPAEINARLFENAGARLRVGGVGRLVLARI
jgi:methyltransferase (TIGR00027 family)